MSTTVTTTTPQHQELTSTWNAAKRKRFWKKGLQKDKPTEMFRVLCDEQHVKDATIGMWKPTSTWNHDRNVVDVLVNQVNGAPPSGAAVKCLREFFARYPRAYTIATLQRVLNRGPASQGKRANAVMIVRRHIARLQALATKAEAQQPYGTLVATGGIGMVGTQDGVLSTLGMSTCIFLCIVTTLNIIGWHYSATNMHGDRMHAVQQALGSVRDEAVQHVYLVAGVDRDPNTLAILPDSRQMRELPETNPDESRDWFVAYLQQYPWMRRVEQLHNVTHYKEIVQFHKGGYEYIRDDTFFDTICTFDAEKDSVEAMEMAYG